MDILSTPPGPTDPTEPSNTDPTQPSDTRPTHPTATGPTDPSQTDSSDSPSTRPSKPGFEKPTEPDLPTIDPGTVNGELDALPLNSYPNENGFLSLKGTGEVGYMDNGKFVRVATTDESATVTHGGKTYSINYRWCQYNDLLFISKYSYGLDSGYYTVTAVAGSNVYAEIEFATQQSVYVYLLNVETGEVTDPLALLDPRIKSTIGDVQFSPDGSLAVISYNRQDDALLYRCRTGEVLKEFDPDDIYSIVTGRFLERDKILLTTLYSNTGSSQWKIYETGTGEIKDYTNLLVPYVNSAGNVRISFISSTQIGTITKSSIYLNDLVTGKCAKLMLTGADYNTNFFSCTGGNIGVIHKNVVYVVDIEAGTMIPVLRIEAVQ